MKTERSNSGKWLLAGTVLFASLFFVKLAGPKVNGTEFKDELHQVYPLATNGRISFNNANGTVRITAWDRPEVRLDAVRRAKNKEKFELVRIEIESGSDFLKINTRYPERKWWGFKKIDLQTAVDYTLTVPQSARLENIIGVNGEMEITDVRGEVHASTVNGALNATGLSSDAGLSSVNGRIKASFINLDGVKSIWMNTVNGAIDLDLPEDANADVSAKTMNGRINGDVDFKRHWPLGESASTTLGTGGAKVSANTMNGNVHISLVKRPHI